MRDIESAPHLSEKIKFNLEKLHRELDVDPHYADAICILVAAGERLKARAGKIADVEGGKDGVTEEDVQVERKLATLIDSFQDGSVFFSEEERTEVPADSAKDVWIADPVSYTKALKEGRPGYAITLARRTEKGTDFAAVYDVARGRMFTAYHGKGAFVNGEKVVIPKTKIDVPRVSIGGANRTLHEAFGSDLENNEIFDTVTIPAESVAINTLKIIDGEIDGRIILAKDIFPHFSSQLIMKEAGGEFTNIRGEENFGYGDTIFVAGATKELHQNLLHFVRRLAQQKGVDVRK